MGRPTLTRHPKFQRLARALGSEALALGHLEFMWLVAYENGDPRLGDSADVEAAAHWTGKAGKLTKALLRAGGSGRAGFIESVPGNSGRGVFQVHDLEDHAPAYVQRRMERENARRKAGQSIRDLRAAAGRKGAEARWQADGKRPPDAMAGDGNRMANGFPRAPAPAPAPEEACAEPPADAGAAAPPVPAEEVFRCMPVNGGTMQFEITKLMVAQWQESYPGVDVTKELLKAIQWCHDNPTRRKTARGARRFLGGWLAREQDRGRRPAGSGPPLKRVPKVDVPWEHS